MSRNSNAIHIALAFDRNFITPFYVLITSLFRSNNVNVFVFHLIATDLIEKEKKEVTTIIEENNSEVFFYEIDRSLTEKFVIPAHTHFSAATYYRLFFPELIKSDTKKLLYLDTDIVVTGDLAELYNTCIDDTPVAASVDPKINKRHDLGIYNDDSYFNAGVLLINLEKWKEQDVSLKAIQFLLNNPEKIQWADQDGLNAVLINNWKKIDSKFNVTYYNIPPYLSKLELKKFLRDKVIIHFTTQHKPWLLSGANRLRSVYQEQLEFLPFKVHRKYSDVNNIFGYLQFLKIRVKEFLIDYTPIFRLKKRSNLRIKY